MAALDSSAPHTFSGATAIRVYDGTAVTPLEVNIIFEGSISWTETGRTITEARSRDRRKSTPVLIAGGDTDITISLSGKITSYLGNSNTHIYEALRKRGNASAWVKTGAGTAHSFDIDFTALSGADGSTTQVATFPYCTLNSLQIDPNGDGNMHSFEAEIICHANEPTWA